MQFILEIAESKAEVKRRATSIGNDQKTGKEK